MMTLQDNNGLNRPLHGYTEIFKPPNTKIGNHKDVPWSKLLDLQPNFES